MSNVQLDHTANAQIIERLKSGSGSTQPSQSPKKVNTWNMGTHPDLVEYLWQTVTQKLPQSCDWVVYHRPVLVHPDSGVIFATAGGSSTLALRLPAAEREEALNVAGYGASHQYPNLTIYAKDFGEDWVLVKPFEKYVPDWCLKAYEYAETL